MRQTHNPKEPHAHYSQGVEVGELIFVAGHASMAAEWEVLHAGDLASQTRFIITDIEAVLQAAGSGLQDVVATTVYLASFENYQDYDRVYAEMFGDTRPVRATVAAGLVKEGLLIEIQATAVKGSG